VAVSPDGRSAYVTNVDGNSISQYDVGSNGALTPKSPASVATSQPGGVAVSPDGRSVYVTNFPNTVTQYDVGSNGALTPKTPPSVSAGANPGLAAVSPDGQNVYVTNVNDNTLSQYDVGANGALTPLSPATLATGVNPFGIAVRSGLGTPPPPPNIGDVIASVQALGLPAGIENALLAKLTEARRNLDAKNRGGACGALGAFINQVEAHSAKKITATDAQALTDQATAVSQPLGCGGG
jgi:hypothetical protein